MPARITEMLGIDFPLFAFSHCRDVVAAVSAAGGFGVLGASSHSPEELEEELTWIDEHVEGRPYGVDIVVPEKLVGSARVPSRQELVSMIPQEHKEFVSRVLSNHGIAIDPEDIVDPGARIPSHEVGQQLLDVALQHPIKLIVNTLGVPPPFMVERARAANVPIGALVGVKEHAIKQVASGVDILIAQGTEAGGHCGDITTMVLVPEVVAAVGPDVPVLAAGGIVTGRQMAAAVALGASGAWTGSVWLTTPEAETAPYTVQKLLHASSRDTVRSSSRTGKPSRQQKSAWTEAWDGEHAPQALSMPLQGFLAIPSFSRIDNLATQGHEGAQDLASYWVGQGVGLMTQVKSSREVVYDFMEDYTEAVTRLAATAGS